MWRDLSVFRTFLHIFPGNCVCCALTVESGLLLTGKRELRCHLLCECKNTSNQRMSLEFSKGPHSVPSLEMSFFSTIQLNRVPSRFIDGHQHRHFWGAPPDVCLPERTEGSTRGHPPPSLLPSQEAAAAVWHLLEVALLGPRKLSLLSPQLRGRGFCRHTHQDPC